MLAKTMLFAADNLKIQVWEEANLERYRRTINCLAKHQFDAVIEPLSLAFSSQTLGEEYTSFPLLLPSTLRAWMAFHGLAYLFLALFLEDWAIRLALSVSLLTLFLFCAVIFFKASVLDKHGVAMQRVSIFLNIAVSCSVVALAPDNWKLCALFFGPCEGFGWAVIFHLSFGEVCRWFLAGLYCLPIAIAALRASLPVSAWISVGILPLCFLYVLYDYIKHERTICALYRHSFQTQFQKHETKNHEILRKMQKEKEDHEFFVSKIHRMNEHSVRALLPMGSNILLGVEYLAQSMFGNVRRSPSKAKMRRLLTVTQRFVSYLRGMFHWRLLGRDQLGINQHPVCPVRLTRAVSDYSAEYFDSTDFQLLTTVPESLSGVPVWMDGTRVLEALQVGVQLVHHYSARPASVELDLFQQMGPENEPTIVWQFKFAVSAPLDCRGIFSCTDTLFTIKQEFSAATAAQFGIAMAMQSVEKGIIQQKGLFYMKAVEQDSCDMILTLCLPMVVREDSSGASEPGLLPPQICERDSYQTTAAPASEAPLAGHGRVLVLDSDENGRELFAAVLGVISSASVFSAASHEEALSLVQQHPFRLLFAELEDEEDLEAVRSLVAHSANPAVPVVGLSAAAERSLREAFYATGNGQAILSKPMQRDSLRAVKELFLQPAEARSSAVGKLPPLHQGWTPAPPPEE